MTLKKGGESLNCIMQLRSLRPIIITKGVKIFKWGSLVKIMKRYVSYESPVVFSGANCESILFRMMALLWSSALRLLLTSPLLRRPQHLLAAKPIKRSRMRLKFKLLFVSLAIPTLFFFFFYNAVLVEMSFNVLPPQQDDAATLDMIAFPAGKNVKAATYDTAQFHFRSLTYIDPLVPLVLAVSRILQWAEMSGSSSMSRVIAAPRRVDLSIWAMPSSKPCSTELR